MEKLNEMEIQVKIPCTDCNGSCWIKEGPKTTRCQCVVGKVTKLITLKELKEALEDIDE